jgi:hypothetical protein
MTDDAIQWVVMCGGLSPYTLELWERVAARPGHRVTLFHVRRPERSDFAHEQGQTEARKVHLQELAGWLQEGRAALHPLIHAPSILVCLGYAPLYNLASSLMTRLSRRARCVVYASDTNGLAQRARQETVRTRLLQLAKRLVVGRAFDTAFTLGRSNTVAHEALGLRSSLELSMLGVPEAEAGALDPELEARLSELPGPRVGAIARLSPEKNLDSLLSAWKKVGRTSTSTSTSTSPSASTSTSTSPSASTSTSTSGSTSTSTSGSTSPSASTSTSTSTSTSMTGGTLLLIGEGPQRPELEQLAGGDSSIVLLGAVPYWQMPAVFARLDAVVLPSRFEPWGIVVTEALCHGLPVLASTEVGAAVSVQELCPGAVQLVGTGVEELAGALGQFMQKLPEHQSAARACAGRVRARYGLQEIAEALVKFAERTRAGAGPG